MGAPAHAGQRADASTRTSRPKPARPGKLALQYWFFYAFNDFNNTHEGDWEMIQLVFDADDAAEALDEEPVEVGYSSHEGAERADWDDDKLEIVDGTHPVVYPAAGSHANKFTEALYLGSSAEAGRRLRRHARPAPRAPAGRPDDPERPARRRGGVPVDHVRGTVGRAAEGVLQRADRPEHEDAVDGRRSNGRRTGATAATPCRPAGVLGTGATDFFCSGVEKGSRALELAAPEPALRRCSCSRASSG